VYFEACDLLLHIVCRLKSRRKPANLISMMLFQGLKEKLIYAIPTFFSTAKVKDAKKCAQLAGTEAERKRQKKAIRIHCWPACRKTWPALRLQQEIQDRVAEVGFDWENDQGVIETGGRSGRI